MYLLGYPKPLRYLNLLLEWITRESSTSVVDSFIPTATPVRIVLRVVRTFGMRRRQQFEPDRGPHQCERRSSVRGNPSAGELS